MAEYIERNEAWFSNCFVEAMKAKLKYGKRVKIIHIPARKNEVFCPHYMWHNLIDGNVYDFHSCDKVKGYIGEFWFKGAIRCRPYAVYERWNKLSGNRGADNG